jgi:hypothetical protein
MLKDNASNYCNNYLWDHLNYIFANLDQAFCKQYQVMQNDEHVYL